MVHHPKGLCRLAQIAEKKAEGKSNAKIGRELDIPKETIRDIGRKLQLAKPARDELPLDQPKPPHPAEQEFNDATSSHHWEVEPRCA